MSITYWWSKDRKWFCILADDGACKSTVSLTQKEARDLGAALSPKIAAAETSPGDVLDVCPSCFGSGRHEGRFGHNDPECTNCNGVGKVAIDRLDVKAEAKSQEPDAVAWRYRLHDGSEVLMLNRLTDNQKARGYYTGEDGEDEVDGDEAIVGPFHWAEETPLYTHPTTKPEAPAVSVDAIARLVDPHSFCLRDETDGRLRTVECDEAIKTATAIAALIAGGR